MQDRDNLIQVNRPTPSGPLRWVNGGVHWISAVVLLYAFVSNGESNGAMTSATAMRGEVRLGLAVAAIFLLRLIWVTRRSTARGGWLTAGAIRRKNWVRSLTNAGIYLGVAWSVVCGLLIALFRTGAHVLPQRRGLTDKASENLAIQSHVSITNALEWLCVFHVAYYGWLWLRAKTRLGRHLESFAWSWCRPTGCPCRTAC